MSRFNETLRNRQWPYTGRGHLDFFKLLPGGETKLAGNQATQGIIHRQLSGTIETEDRTERRKEKKERQEAKKGEGWRGTTMSVTKEGAFFTIFVFFGRNTDNKHMT